MMSYNWLRNELIINLINIIRFVWWVGGVVVRGRMNNSCSDLNVCVL